MVSQTSIVGDDDGFDGIQSSDSDPGDGYIVGLLPEIPPGSYLDEEGIDHETRAP